MTGSVLLLNILLSAISDCAYTMAVGLTLAAYFTTRSDKTPPITNASQKMAPLHSHHHAHRSIAAPLVPRCQYERLL